MVNPLIKQVENSPISVSVRPGIILTTGRKECDTFRIQNRDARLSKPLDGFTVHKQKRKTRITKLDCKVPRPL